MCAEIIVWSCFVRLCYHSGPKYVPKSHTLDIRMFASVSIQLPRAVPSKAVNHNLDDRKRYKTCIWITENPWNCAVRAKKTQTKQLVNSGPRSSRSAGYQHTSWVVGLLAFAQGMVEHSLSSYIAKGVIWISIYLLICEKTCGSLVRQDQISNQKKHWSTPFLAY